MSIIRLSSLPWRCNVLLTMAWIFLSLVTAPNRSFGDFCPPLFPATAFDPEAVAIAAGDVVALLRALRQARPGTTLKLEDGLYTLAPQQSLEVNTPHVTIRSASGKRETVIIEGGYNNISINASDVTVADLTLRTPKFHNIQVRGERGVLRTRIYNVHLLDAGQQLVKVSTGDGRGEKFADAGLVACSLLEYSTYARGTDVSKPDYTNGVDILAGKDWVIQDNVFRRIRSAAGPAGPAVLVWRNAMGTVVQRNLFIDCWRGIALGLAAPHRLSRGGAQVAYDHQDGLVRNNVILALHEPADVAIENNYARYSRVLHNTVYYAPELRHAVHSSIEYRFPPTTTIIRNNLTNLPIRKRHPAPQQESLLQGNLVNALPSWFRHIAQGDAHLVAGSPAVDQEEVLDEASDDIDGERRLQAADVGADEVTPH